MSAGLPVSNDAGGVPFTAGYEFTWAARQYGEREAVIFEDERVTFAEVNRRGNRLANALVALGLDGRHRVAVLLDNGLQSIDTVVGATKAGVTYLALNARHTAAEHRRILADGRPSVIIAGARFQDVVGEALQGLEHDIRVVGLGWHGSGGEYAQLLGTASDREPGIEVRPGDLMRLHYTSGTTGEPKGIMMTFRHYFARQANFFAALEYALGADDTMIHVGPLTHAAGQYLVPYHLRGARNIVMRGFDPVAMQALIERERVTHLLLVPTMLIRLLDELQPDRFDLSSLTRINYGTAPMPVDVLRRAIQAFGPVLRGHYGLSECPQPATVLYPHEHVLEGEPRQVGRLASCGRPTLNVDLRIHDASGKPLPAGEVGEICIRAVGAADVQYWQRPDLRASTVRDGWYYSGDLGWMDDDGFLFIVGRVKDMIISGGFNVYSREVEEALFDHPDVLEAAVLGLPHAEWGEVVCAFVVRRPGCGLDAGALVAHCRERIAGYKLPRMVEFIDALARNNTGKVDKARLRTLYCERHGIDADSLDAHVTARY